MGWRQELREVEERSSFQRGDRLAGFVLHRLIGLSVTGEIWQARHERTQNLVAVRLFGLMGLPGGMETLRHEAELSRHLRHPNIVRVFGLKTSSEAAMLVTELVEGRSLAHLLRTTREHGLSFPPAAALEVALGIARALEHAWDGPDAYGAPYRIVHRDLTASKVLIGWDGQVRIGGFSVARAASDLRRTRTGVIRGELSCMSPERLEGSELLGPPTDLYSLGVLLWEMGSGRPFHQSTRLTSIFRTCRERSPDEEARVVGELIPDAAPLVRRLLQRDFDQRPQLASEVVEELEGLLRTTPCEGGILQLVDRAEVLEAMEPGGEASVGSCPWDTVVELAGRPRVEARDGATPRPHPSGPGICGVRRSRSAREVAEVSTSDWTSLPDDDSTQTADWTALTIEDEEWGDG